MQTRSDLFEREEILGLLEGKISSLVTGSGGTLLIEGPAGIGKSRLLAEAQARAGTAGVRTVTGHGSELESEFAFGAVRQLFEPLLADMIPEERAELFSGAAQQATSVLGPTTDVPSGDFSTLHGLYWLTVNLAHKQPLLIAIDDLQWVDAPSLRYFVYLQPRIGDLPILLTAATRPNFREETGHLIEMIATDAATEIALPLPLSQKAAALIIRDIIDSGERADETFFASCYEATGGNPLLLKQLAQVITAEGLEPVDTNARKVIELGPRAVARYTSVRLRELPGVCTQLAESVAILGDSATLQVIAAYAGITLESAAHAASLLQQVNILEEPEFTKDGSPAALNYVHPLIRAAVYGSMQQDRVMAAHAHAAEILTHLSAEPERVAAHLLQTLPKGNQETVRLLADAASSAISRGSPDSAYAYWRRALAEPPGQTARLDALMKAGACALLINLTGSVDLLREALSLCDDLNKRAEIRVLLGGALMYLQRAKEGVDVYREGINESTTENSKRLLAAGVVSSVFQVQDNADLVAYADELADLPPDDSLGGRALDSMIAMVRWLKGDSSAVHYARRAIADGRLVEMANGEPFLPMGVWYPLLAADCTEAFSSINDALAGAHRSGFIRALAPASDFRGLGLLWQGYLADAEVDLRRAKRAIEAAGVTVGRPFNGSFRAHLFMSQGRLEEAQGALEWAQMANTTDTGAGYLILAAKARLQRLRGDYEQGLTAAIEAGQRFSAVGGLNPAIVPWRSEAALCLRQLNRADEASQYALREVELARQWQGKRALARALRIAGLVIGGDEGLDHLSEAVSVAEQSPACLEYATGLVALGTALRRSGKRSDAQAKLRRGAELAHNFGAVPLLNKAMTELRVTGSRPRRIALTGPEALTPSERRVAELASSGMTNRDIAQRLFVTIKTVEVHLTSVYRKLGISRREDIVNKFNQSERAT
ncbi:helix-turn-helix transcriptional regulator [Streptomyces chartreusis]|uniref:helix-turn-helix transcriptional regulator n=1 Tax=Streptomyces chartreusis TaxID=1969 RepID=UPI0036862FF0